MKHKTSSADDKATGLPLMRLMNRYLAEACNAAMARKMKRRNNIRPRSLPANHA